MSSPPSPTERRQVPVPCPNCGTPSAGKFCAECGAAVIGAACATCTAPLTPGARFCHRCGAGVGAVAAAGTPRVVPVATPGQRSILPWAIALTAAIALVITVAAQRGASAPPTGQSLEQSDSAPVAPFAGAGGDARSRAPDISSLSPRERADRLYDRVMRLASENKSDSATFFASMALGAYEALSPFDLDLRYDYGRMAEMSGNLALAQAQSDSILGSNPNHLLGLILGARVAQVEGKAAVQQRYYTKLLAVRDAELRKNLEEYVRHRGDIDGAVLEAKAQR